MRPRRIVAAAARYGSFNWAGLLLAIIAVGIVFTYTSPFFLTTGNLANLSRAVGYTGIVAAITTLVLVSGAIDLSIAAMMSLAGVATAWSWTERYTPTFIATLATCVSPGLVHIGT